MTNGWRLCCNSTRALFEQAGNQTRTMRLRSTRPGHSVGSLLCSVCTLLLLLSAAFLLSKKVTLVVIFFNSSPAAESLRCRMLPIKTLEQSNLKRSIFCSTLFLFSFSQSHSGLDEVKSETRWHHSSLHYVTMLTVVEIICETRCYISWGRFVTWLCFHHQVQLTNFTGQSFLRSWQFHN